MVAINGTSKLRILCLSADRELALLRRRVLESAAHEVVAPLSDKEAFALAAEPNRFDVAIICYRMWAGSERRLMRLFHEHNPRGKCVVMVRVYGEVPELEADRYVVGSDGPDALLNVLAGMQSASSAAQAENR